MSWPAGSLRQLRPEQGGGQGSGLWAGSDAELAKPDLEKAEGAADGVGPSGGTLEPHDLLVDEFVVGVVAERGLQGREGLLGVTRRGDLGDPGPRVEGAVAGLLGVGLGPVVSGSVGERAAISRYRLLESSELRVLVAGLAGFEQGALEPPDVDVEQGPGRAGTGRP